MKQKKYKIKKASFGAERIAVPEVRSGFDVAASAGGSALSSAQLAGKLTGGNPYAMGAGAIIGGGISLGKSLLNRREEQDAAAYSKRYNKYIEKNANIADDPNLQSWQNNNFTAEKGAKVKGEGVLEIEGREAPEIHLRRYKDKKGNTLSYDIINLGTTPHSQGGDKIKVQDDDVIIDSQNSKKDFDSIMRNIKNFNATKNKSSLKAIENRISQIKGGDVEVEEGQQMVDGNPNVTMGQQFMDYLHQTPRSKDKPFTNDELTAFAKSKDMSPQDLTKSLGTDLKYNVGSWNTKGAIGNMFTDAVNKNFKFTDTSTPTSIASATDQSTGDPFAANAGLGGAFKIGSNFSPPPAPTTEPTPSPISEGSESMLGINKNFKMKPLVSMDNSSIGGTIPNNETPSTVPSTNDVSNRTLSDAGRFANIGYNLLKGTDKAATLPPNKLQLGRLKYKDLSDPLRSANLVKEKTDMYNAGNVGSSRAQQIGYQNQASAAGYRNRLGIEANETQRRDVTNNANMQLSNQEKMFGADEFNQQRLYNAQASAKRDLYTGSAFKEMTELSGNLSIESDIRTREANARAMDERMLESGILQSERYDIDPVTLKYRYKTPAKTKTYTAADGTMRKNGTKKVKVNSYKLKK